MKPIWYSGLASCPQHRSIIHRFGIPHLEFRFISLVVVNKGHEVPIILVGVRVRPILSIVERFSGRFCFLEIDSAQYLFIEQIILDDAIKVHIVTANLIIWQLGLKDCKVYKSLLVSNQILVNNRELHIDVINQDFP